MKKLLTIASILLFVITTAYAIDLLEDKEMSDVEGQAGLSITPFSGSIQITQALRGLSWGDDDGYTAVAGGGPGHLAIHGLNLAGAAYATMGMTIGLSNTIHIDVDTSGIFLRLGTVQISVDTPPRMSFAVSGGAAMNIGPIAHDSVKTLGDLAMDTMQVTVSVPGTIKIAPH